MVLKVFTLLIHEAEYSPCRCSDHYFHTGCPSVPKLQNQLKITTGLAGWIIDDSCIVSVITIKCQTFEKDTILLFLPLFISERGLGPTLYGVFPEGRLEEFIPARSMTPSEVRASDYSEVIARKIASIHSLSAPINKETQWLRKTLTK